MITSHHADERLDKFLAQALPEYSRSQIQDWIKAGDVLLNQEKVKANYRLEAGDQIDLEVKLEEEGPPQAEKIDLDILYQDEDLAIINKEQGMVVHPGHGNQTGSLVNALLYHLDSLSDLNGEDRPGIVHRLDKDTSGLLVVAKNNPAHKALADQFKARQPKREYVAMVQGQMDHLKGKIDLPIGRDPHNRLKFSVQKDGKTAITYFEVIEQFSQYAYLACRLETGRTHQIRVHLSHLGHPIVGDEVYGHKSSAYKGSGQLLHARTIGFKHPTSGDYLEFTQEPPQNFQDFLKEVKGDRP